MIEDLLPGLLIPVVSGVAGLLIGGLTRIAPKWYQKRVNRQKLRRALLAEVRTPQEAIESASRFDESDDVEVDHTVFPNAVYQKHIDDIGLLSDEEVEAVIKYYSTLEVARDQLRSERDHSGVKQFLTTVEYLVAVREDAEMELRKKLDGQGFIKAIRWREETRPVGQEQDQQPQAGQRDSAAESEVD